MITEEEMKEKHPLQYLERILCHQCDVFSAGAETEKNERMKTFALGRLSAFEDILSVVEELRRKEK